MDHLGVQRLVAKLNATAIPAKSARIKLDLWTAISNLVDSMDGIWITMGDFKVVRSRSERAGSQFDAKEAFNDFSANVGFNDFNLNG
ncbi:hypothetical protein Tco_1481287 [Tanacetum coccineum]